MLMVSCMVCVYLLLPFLQELRVKDVELKRLSDMINIEKKERQALQARLSNSECGGVELSKLRHEIAALRTAGK